jgi:hypothetical protein
MIVTNPAKKRASLSDGPSGEKALPARNRPVSKFTATARGPDLLFRGPRELKELESALNQMKTDHFGADRRAHAHPGANRPRLAHRSHAAAASHRFHRRGQRHRAVMDPEERTLLDAAGARCGQRLWDEPRKLFAVACHKLTQMQSHAGHQRAVNKTGFHPDKGVRTWP